MTMCRSILTETSIASVVAAAGIAAAVAGAQTRDKTGTPMVHKADEGPQVVRNEPLAEPRSLLTERAGFEPAVP